MLGKAQESARRGRFFLNDRYQPDGSEALYGKMKCSEHIEEIISIAFAASPVQASEHVLTCVRCSESLAKMRRVAAGLATQTFEAPEELIHRASALVPPPPKSLPLLRSSLQFAGARKASIDSFQRVFAADGTEIRVAYSKGENHWKVMVRAPENAFLDPDHDIPVTKAGTAYEFEAQSLDLTGFCLDIGTGGLRIPPGSEPLEDVERR
jgi:hypothetical protein